VVVQDEHRIGLSPSNMAAVHPRGYTRSVETELISQKENPLLGSQDLVVGLVIVVVLFGAKKIPELAGSLGKSLKEFKKGVSDATEEAPAAPPSATPSAANACAACRLPVQPDWQHCPRCGASMG
jgi:sec-independent protein translocase protein TatA